MLICDTPKCGTETHLRCAGLDAVPEGDWFCDACSAKHWKRKASGAPAKPKRPRRETETAAAAPKHASPVVLSPAVVSAEVDGKELPKDAYELGEETFTLHAPPSKAFTLKTVVCCVEINQ